MHEQPNVKNLTTQDFIALNIDPTQQCKLGPYRLAQRKDDSTDVGPTLG